MIIGVCGDAHPDVERELSAALPDAQIVVVSAEVRSSDRSLEPHVDVLVPLDRTVDGALMDATRPSLIQQFGIGLEGVDIEAARIRRIPVANLSGAETGNAAAAAEIAMLHLLALLRRYRQAQQSVSQRRVGAPSGNMLVGKTVAVLGVGAVGSALVPRLEAFGAIPIGIGRRGHDSVASVLPADRYFRLYELSIALGRSNALIVCCPLTDQTRGLIARDELAALPSGGYLVNVGRGPIVDYRALLEALMSGHLAGAGIDVGWVEPIDPDDALLDQNVSITPHIGAATVESFAAMARAFAASVRRFEGGDVLLGQQSDAVTDG